MKKYALTLFSILAITLTSCLGNREKSEYDNGRLNELTEKYFNDEPLSRQDWEDFLNQYSAGTDKAESVYNNLISKVKPGMTLDAVTDLFVNSGTDLSALAPADGVVYYGCPKDAPDDISQMLIDTRERKKTIVENYQAQVLEIIGVEEPVKPDTPKVEEKSKPAQVVDTPKDAASVYTIDDFILTPSGLGPVKLGMNKNNIPTQVVGVYDAKRGEKYNHEMDMYVPSHVQGYVTYTLKGEPQFDIEYDTNGRILTVNVCSRRIPTALGPRVNDPLTRATSISGGELQDDVFDNLAYIVKGYYIYAWDGVITAIRVGDY